MRVSRIIIGILCVLFALNPATALALDTPDVDQFYQTNDILFYDPNAIPCVTAVDLTTTGGSTSGDFSVAADIKLQGANNAEKVMNFLLGQGFNLGAASGMMGNFSVESGFNPEATNPTSGAYGLAQWLGGRKTNLKKYSSDSYNTLEIQLQYLMFELSGTEKAAMAVKNETTPAKAALTWEKLFERSGSAALGERSKRAEAIFDQWTKTKSLPNNFLSAYSSGTTSSSVSAEAAKTCSTPAGSGILGEGDLKGYSFPIAVTSKKSLSTFGGALNRLPCTGVCHHDGSYAFDLGVTGYGEPDSLINPNSTGAPVYAISDGKITSRSDNPNAVRKNCTQYTLKSSVDQHEWWFGHLALKGAAAQQGQTVKAGQLLGYVGHSNCADNTAPHLHIDSGGGIISQRNRLVSDVINGLYNQLPDN